MPPQDLWSPTAHAFAHHQFSHVANFWKQGRQARFRLEALPGGHAELHLTFQLPPASEMVLLCPQSLLLSTPFVPSFLKAASHKGLLQTWSPSTPPKSRFHQGNAKANSAQCFTEQPWLRPPSLLQRMVPFARLHKPVFNASKLFQ